jgi:hypothetical protein
MISPFIKWDHSEDHFVFRYDTNETGSCAERKVTISLNDPDYEFIQGHCIDGKL